MSFFGDSEKSGSASSFQNVRPIDLNKLAPMYGGAPRRGGPEFIGQNKQGRDIYGRLCFNSGVLWLGGFLGGGIWGGVEGWRGAVAPNYKIRANNVLNGVSRRGSTLGSSLAIIAFFHTTGIYVGAELLELEQRSGTPWAVPAFAGAVTGALYKCTSKSARAVALASVLGSGASCLYWFGSAQLFKTGGRY